MGDFIKVQGFWNLHRVRAAAGYLTVAGKRLAMFHS
jgi:hypothetical protein